MTPLISRATRHARAPAVPALRPSTWGASSAARLAATTELPYIQMLIDGQPFAVRASSGILGGGWGMGGDPDTLLGASSQVLGSGHEVWLGFNIWVAKEPGTYHCRDGEALLWLIHAPRGNGSIEYQADNLEGIGRITVESMDNDAVRGTFSGTLVNIVDAFDRKTITRGSFHLPNNNLANRYFTS